MTLITISRKDYLDTLDKIEQLKCLMHDVQSSCEVVLPQGITIELQKEAIPFLNWIKEAEVALTEYVDRCCVCNL